MTDRRSGRSTAGKRISESMSLDELAGHVQRFDAETPISTGLRRRIYPSNTGTTPSSLKKSWQVWFDNYKETGHKYRKDSDRDAGFVYNQLKFVLMLIWLAESAGVSRDLLERASAAVPEVATGPTQAGRFRKIIPWKVVEAALAMKGPPPPDGPKRQDSPEDWEARAEAALRAAGAGFGTPEENKKVEKAAITFVRRYLEKAGWKVRSVEQERCGFDLDCLKPGGQLHVEVKGVSGETCAFILTNGELNQAKKDKSFEIHAVTSVLKARPTLTVISGPALERDFNLKAIQWMATPVAAV